MNIQILQRFALTSPRRRSRCRPGLEGLERRDVPAIFTVNSLQDLVNPPAGTVTLRSALAQANATPGGNTINLTIGGTYAIGNGTNGTGSGAFQIQTTGGNLSITNTSGQPVEIDGGGASRVFDINSTDVNTPINVAFSEVTIQNGSATATGQDNGSGGGIRSDGPVNLSLTNVTLLNNLAAAQGGGLYINAPAGQAWSLTTNASTFITNQSGGGGGGVFAGSGTANSGTVNVTSSEFSGNITTGFGGGLDVGPISTAFLVSNSTFNGNTATQDGGAIDYSGSGQVVHGNIVSSLTNCTIVGNKGGLVGGGVALELTGDLAFVNDTINGNSVSGNPANNFGGGIYNGNSSNILTFLNSIVAMNTVPTAANGPDIYDGSLMGVNDDLGNFIGTIGQGQSGFKAGTLTGNPFLSVLQDNGGPSIGSLANPQDLGTEAPLLSSPVVNGGNVVGGTPSSPSTDERGLPRSTTAGGHVAIGAFQPQGTTVTPSQVFVVESDGQVYDKVGGSYVLTAPKVVSAMQTVRLGDTGNYIVFVVGSSDNQVYAEKISSNGTSSGYYPTAYGSVLSMTAGTDASGNPLLFVISTSSDNFQLYEQKFNLNGDPTSGGSYTKAAFGNFKTAIVTHDANGNPLLYATGQDNLAYGLQMNVSGAPVGGLFRMGTGAVNQLAVGHDADNNPELFVVGTDAGLGNPGYVYSLKANPNGSPAVGQGVYNSGIGGPVRSLSLDSDASNNPELFVIGTDTKPQPYAHKFNATGDPVGTFFSLASGVSDGVSALAAGYDGNEDPLLYVVDATTGQVDSLSFNASGSVNGTFTPSATGKVKTIVLA